MAYTLLLGTSESVESDSAAESDDAAESAELNKKEKKYTGHQRRSKKHQYKNQKNNYPQSPVEEQETDEADTYEESNSRQYTE